jgi:hypothetical protein
VVSSPTSGEQRVHIVWMHSIDDGRTGLSSARVDMATDKIQDAQAYHVFSLCFPVAYSCSHPM